jgi:hypothetical protein
MPCGFILESVYHSECVEKGNKVKVKGLCFFFGIAMAVCGCERDGFSNIKSAEIDPSDVAEQRLKDKERKKEAQRVSYEERKRVVRPHN